MEENDLERIFSRFIGVTMVVDVLMLMHKHIVHVHRTIVVDDANCDITHTIMSTYTTPRIMLGRNEETFFFCSLKKCKTELDFSLEINKKFRLKLSEEISSQTARNRGMRSKDIDH